MPPPIRCPSLIPSIASTRQLCRTTPQTTRCFSTTPRNDQRATRARRALFAWLATRGAVFKDPVSGSTNYMSAYNRDGVLFRMVEAQAEKSKEAEKAEAEGKQSTAQTTSTPKDRSQSEALPPETSRDLRPFRANQSFVSQRVLTSKFQEQIWKMVIEDGMSVRDVSAEVNVEMSRVAAVVRLVEIEKEWIRINKPLAKPYAEAIQGMLPKTEYIEDKEERGKSPLWPHESINDLPVHAATGQQIWLPTSESRHFTRADAAKVFDDKLLPADARVPHPELALQHRERRIEKLAVEERRKRAWEREEKESQRSAVKEARRAAKAASVKTVDIGRYVYQFTEIKVDDAGKDGRGINGVGWRYGAPLMDRSRGQHKIPHSVE